MTDTEIIDWMQTYMIGFAKDPKVNGDGLVLFWSVGDGQMRVTTGYDLRDCVRGAKAGEYDIMPHEEMTSPYIQPTGPGGVN